MTETVARDEQATEIADRLTEARDDLRAVAQSLEVAADLIREFPGFEDAQEVRNIERLVSALYSQVGLEASRWSVIEDNYA
jgi:hypothetical protein